MSNERKLVSVEEIAKLLANEDGDWPFSIADGQVELVIESGVYTLTKEEFARLQETVKSINWKEYSGGEEVETPESMVERLLGEE